MKKRMYKQIIALLLCLTLMPISALAAVVDMEGPEGLYITAVFNVETGRLTVSGTNMPVGHSYLVGLYSHPFEGLADAPIYYFDDFTLSNGSFVEESSIVLLLEPYPNAQYELVIRFVPPLGSYASYSWTWSFALPTITPTSFYGTVDELFDELLEPCEGENIVFDQLLWEWSVLAGDLPSGLSLEPDTGEILGVPTEAGTFTLTVRFSNSTFYVEETITITIVPTEAYEVHTVTIENGGVGAAVTDGEEQQEGSEVTISAGTRAGFAFNGWTFNTDVTIADGSSAATATTTFIMPAGDVIATANWRAVSGQGSGSGPTTRPPDPEPEQEEYTPVKPLRRQAFLVGVNLGDGRELEIRPRANISRAEVATIFFRLIEDDVRANYWEQDNPFDDVRLEQWFNNAVSTTVNMGLFEGIGNDLFAPMQSITRGELAAALVRFMDWNLSGEFTIPLNLGDSFNDISGHWAREYINRAAQSGWVEGPAGFGGPFNPNATLTRAEAAAMVNRVFQRLIETPECLLENMISWPDNRNAASWYFLYMYMATNSYTYEWRTDNERYKELIDIIEPRDWTVLERPNSRPEHILA